ncbi:MAG: hypothetical protein MR210_06820 [Erysipelotrichaceae bacterium]|nr:hypothetical protein [Erysipelotrichaceae bacterium]MDY5251820.1 hypothetical protein [Erysipelotrichaceae bacterium]
MKKIIILMMIVCLSACTNQESNVSTSITNNDDVSEEVVTSAKAYIGQISAMTGNSISLSVGEISIDENDQASETYIYDGSGDTRVASEEELRQESGMMLMIPAGDGEEATQEREKMPIVFTGEVLEFTIPAGAKITNALGKEVSFDQLKTGSLIQLIVNEQTAIVERIILM